MECQKIADVVGHGVAAALMTVVLGSSLYGTALWGRMTDEQKLELSRQELASVASTGSASIPAASAATKMAGQTRSPRRSTAASAKGCTSPPANGKIRLG